MELRRPIIVHCSTGVGRAGTFVAIELLLETLMSGCKCDMPAFLSGLRQQRAMAVNVRLPLCCFLLEIFYFSSIH